MLKSLDIVYKAIRIVKTLLLIDAVKLCWYFESVPHYVPTVPDISHTNTAVTAMKYNIVQEFLQIFYNNY